MNPVGRRSTGRWLLVLLLFLFVATAVLAVSAWVVVDQSGRTPGEVIDRAERRLQGHPWLEQLAIPALEGLRQLSGEPSAVDQSVPFVFAKLASNPATPPAVGLAGIGNDRIIRVGPTRAITRIAVAAELAGDGSVIEIDPGDYVADVASWDRAELTIRGLGNRVRLLAAGAHAEGKAIWVIRRGKVTIENIEFVGARVPDRNGAGIRLESGHLLVRGCTFLNNENGILTSNDSSSKLEVEDTEIGYSGAGDGLSHGIYVGSIASFRLKGSYVHHSNVGHLVKSRARFNRVEYNRLSDETGGRASYELEFPNGGVAEVVGNIIQQGSGARNSIMVSIGAEGYTWPHSALQMSHNTLVNDHRAGGTFVRVAPGAGATLIRNNLWVGSGKVEAGGVSDVAGNRQAEWTDLVRPSREDYRIADHSRRALSVALLGSDTDPMRPLFEYLHPLRVRALAAPPQLAGALQSSAP